MNTTNPDASSSSRSEAQRHADAAAVFADFKAASGGVRWDNVHSLHDHGSISIGGMSGEFHAIYDLHRGRSCSRHAIGAIKGAAGYDGDAAWQRGPGGEIARLDAPEALRRARSQAWLDARAYWYPQRMPASFGVIETREQDGSTFRLIEVVPDHGDPIALWFAADNGLLARIVRRRGAVTAITVLDDYRDIDGLQLPFLITTDRADASGDVDPRLRTQIVLDRITPNLGISDVDFALPTMDVRARIDDPSGTTHVRFELINNHIYVDAGIDGKFVRLMVDTGGMNLLSPAAAQRLGLGSEGKLAASGPGEKRPDVAMANAKQLRVGAVTLDDPVLYVIDLGELPQAEGVALDGVVGYEMFRRFGVCIDYAGQQMTITEASEFVPPSNATEIPFEFDRLTPIVSGVLDGLPVRVLIDTGSRASLSMHSPFVREHDLVAKYQAAPESVMGWGIGGAARMRAARFGQLQLGGLTITGIAGDLFTGDKGGLNNPDQAGNLGSGVLKRFTVTFDYSRKRMYLAPNDAFADADAFDRSGLWLLADDDELKVFDVAAGSAADHAGVRENDRVIAIDGESVATRSLHDWRQRLRELPAGARVTMRLQRDGEIIDAALELADRIRAS